MKTIWYEGVKVLLNKLLPVVTVLALFANSFLIYTSMANSGENAFIAKNIITYNKIMDNYKYKPASQAYDELNALNNDLQAFIYIQSLAQNLFEESEEDINAHLRQIDSKYPGILKRYNDKNYTLYSGSIETDGGLVNDIFNKISYINGYKDYIDSINDKKNEMLSVSVFNKKGTFAYLNIMKTPKDFSPLRDIQLKLDTSAGIVCATDCGLTDIFVSIIVFLICIYLIALEKDMKLLPLIKSTMYGRGKLIIAKLLILSLSSCILATLFYGSNILLAQHVFGLGDIGRYVQSIPEFRGCTALMTVGQYLITFLLHKMLVVILLSHSIFLVILLASNSTFAYISITITLAAEWVAWRFIPVNLSINYLKFINIFGFMDMFSIYSNYQNLNIFGQPVNIRLITYIVIPICISTVTTLSYIAFTRLRYSEKISILARLLDKIKLLLSILPGTSSLFFQELYKILITQKALIVIALLIILQYFTVSGYSIIIDSDEIIYQHYLQQVNGELTDITQTYITQEQANFDDAAKIVANADEDLKENRITKDEYNGIIARNSVLQGRATAFGWITSQYRYLEELNKGRGIRAWFIDLRGYTQLFSLNGYSADLSNALLIIAAIIACAAAVFAHDNSIRAKKIIVACREGRGRDIYHRYLACYLVVFIMAILVYGAQFYNICKWYHLSDWEAPVQSVMSLRDGMVMSVPQFSNFPINVTIGQYAVIIYSIRLLGIFAVVSVVLLVSSLNDNIFISIFASTAILEVPLLLYLLGFNEAKYFSFIGPLSSNMIFAEDSVIFSIIALPILLISFIVLVLYFAKHAFCRKCLK